MEELKELIISLFQNNNNYYNEQKLKKLLKIKGEEKEKILIKALNELESDGILYFDIKNGYKLITNELGIACGRIEIAKNGNGYVHTKDNYTILIENSKLNGALNNDTVLVSSITANNKGEFFGEILKVTKRASGTIIMKVKGNGLNAKIEPYSNHDNIKILINKNEYKNLYDGEVILVKVGCEQVNNSERIYIASIEKSIGHIDDPDINTKIIFEKYNIPIDFSEEVLEEAKKIPSAVSENDISGRIDLRNKQIVTIDCDETKDRDDAVYVEKLENGNYILYVSIAAVSYYIKPGMKLFDAAIERCNSFYINNSCVPMLPHSISNGICSLSENLDRLCRTYEIEIDSDGNIVNYKNYPSVINSKKAMRYSDVNKILDNKEVCGYEQYYDQIKLMQELSEIIEKNNNKRNKIDLKISETKEKIVNNETIFIDNFGGKAEKIIENFMITANQCVAEEYGWIPFFPFRTQSCPNIDAVKEVIDFLRTAGYNIPAIKNINAKNLHNILRNIEENTDGEIISKTLLKKMKRAEYNKNNCGHFFLQLENYTHFTSPIRRVIDLIIHTIIDLIDSIDYSEEAINNREKEIQEICNNANEKERKSKEMEEEGIISRMAKEMEQHIGEEFEGIIIEIFKNGLLIKTTNKGIGKVKLDDIEGDKFFYDTTKKAIIGKKTKQKYRLGNKVVVLVKDASEANRTIDFIIKKEKSLKKIF